MMGRGITSCLTVRKREQSKRKRSLMKAWWKTIAASRILLLQLSHLFLPSAAVG